MATSESVPLLAEIKVEGSNVGQISNADAQRPIAHQSYEKTLCKAALRGDWNAAKNAAKTALGSDKNIAKNIASVKITERGDGALHIAAATKQTAFVRNLVKQLDEEDLKLENNQGYTAFCIAAGSGVVEIAKVMYEKYTTLPKIRTEIGKTPLEMAVLLGRRKMVEYLYPITPLKEFKAEERMDILIATIHSDMYGMESPFMTLGKMTMKIMFVIVEKLFFLCANTGLKIFRADRSVVTSSPKKTIEQALLALAQKPLSHNGSQEWIWERLDRIVSYLPWICGSIQKRRQAGKLLKELWEQILTLEDSDIAYLISESQILEDAVRVGNVEFFTLLTNSYPDILWKVNEEMHSIFHFAVINRQEKIFSLIYQTGFLGDMMMLLKDEFGNNILHLAAKLAPPSRLNIVSGAALQMQSEIRWFKVEKILRPCDVQLKNYGKTRWELFTEKHKELQEVVKILRTSDVQWKNKGKTLWELFMEKHEELQEEVEKILRSSEELQPQEVVEKILQPSKELQEVAEMILQPSKELQEVVKKISRPFEVQLKNKGKTPWELFREEHKELRKASENWVKERATNCMVVATLIATVAFAAAFTVPGGIKEETGAPIFLHNGMFKVFVISDAAAMFSSTASIIMFLSLLTSRYEEVDFLFSLPLKLMVGVITLFASVICMVLTFSATYVLVYKEEIQGILPKYFAAFAWASNRFICTAKL